MRSVPSEGAPHALTTMKLLTLRVLHYRSLRDQDIDLDDLNVFIGANASGKSTILDALRFLSEGVRGRDLRAPVFARGGIVHLAWKGESADRIELIVRLQAEDTRYEWSLCLVRHGYEFDVVEQVLELPGTGLHGKSIRRNRRNAGRDDDCPAQSQLQDVR